MGFNLIKKLLFNSDGVASILSTLDPLSNIRIATKAIPQNLLFSGLPLVQEGFYTRLRYLKPLANHIKVPHSENIYARNVLLKKCILTLQKAHKKLTLELNRAKCKINESFLTFLQDIMETYGIEMENIEQNNDGKSKEKLTSGHSANKHSE